MYLDALAQLIVDGFHDLQVAFLVQRAQHRLERCALLLRRHRRLYTEQALDQLRVIVRSVLRIIKLRDTNRILRTIRLYQTTD